MFGGDPFGDPFANMRRHMRMMDRMMEDMMEPFGMMDPFFGGRQQSYGQNAIENGQDPRDPRNQRQVSQRRNRAQDDMDVDLMPFGGGLFGGGLFGGISNLMNQMEGLSQRAMNDPNSHVYTQSTMISFDGSGAPRVVQESTRKAGDVKETRRSVQNGMDGEAEMEVGHHVGNKSHIIEKKRDKDGKVRQQQRFVNLDEEEAETFDKEFKTRAQHNMTNLFGSSNNDRDSNRAIENGPSHSNHRSDRPRGSSSRSTTSYRDHTSGSGGDNAPIVTIPDDDEEYEVRRNHRRNNCNNDAYYYPSSSGPTIREISEEEADMSIPKRRKGMFGRFFNDD